MRQNLVRTTVLVSGLSFALLAGGALAQTQTYRFDIPSEALSVALRDFAHTSGQEIIFTNDLVEGKTAPELRGTYSSDQALARLLTGTNLVVERSPSGAIMVRKKGQQHVSIEGAATEAQTEVESVVVTGTRIKGAPPSSPVNVISQQQMLEAGQYNLGDVVRSMPQNFSGGQNPGVALGSADENLSNSNETGGSAIDLRGLGPDATLTLLNGRRLSYDSFSQAVDLSTIPVAAVDRIEVVTDGASALYGSDAVAGVANIVLRRDYDGVSTQVRLGQATEGGDFQQQYDIVGGKTWSDGGFIATYDFSRNTAVYATQRNFTSDLSSVYTLLPPSESNSFVISGHQDLSSSITFSLDALYSKRSSSTGYFYPPNTYFNYKKSEAYTISPTIDFSLPGSWSASIGGIYGHDNAHITSVTVTPGGTLEPPPSYCDCNSIEAVEVNSEGPLFDLPGGQARVAVGAGYRRNQFDQKYQNSVATDVTSSRSSYYGYAEVYLPLVSGVSLVNNLLLSGAARYEHYSDFGSITTPKVGLVYSPIPGVELKGSWGQSFKAPTLYQEHTETLAYLFPASFFGAVGYPPTATAIFAIGGNPALKPERADTWSTTINFHPTAVPGLLAEVSYFAINYTNRVSRPFTDISTAFINPTAGQYLILNPTAAEQLEFINSAIGGLTNYSGQTYGPSDVAGIVNDEYNNVATQSIHGLDFSLTYRLVVGNDAITLNDAGTWISSKQKNSASAPTFHLAGTVYNPPTFRTRFGATWEHGQLTASGFVNYIGGVTDLLTVPSTQTSSMITEDVTVLYRLHDEQGLLRGLDLSLAVQNITDQKPPYLEGAPAYSVRYDSTNYSPIGRLVSFSISKRW